VINKNTKDFAGIKGGLTYIKLSQLIKTKKVDRILLSTNDEKVIEIAKSFKDDRIAIDIRAEELASSNTLNDTLVEYVPSVIESGVVLWTHVTSPFINEDFYDKVIEEYESIVNKGYDSIVSATSIRKYLWNNEGPINYDKTKEKWPRTQYLEQVYELNSAFFLSSIDIYKKYYDRMGIRPFFYEIDNEYSYDIDWEPEFKFAEVLWKEKEKL
jgi:CMP-N-acetylneuraminic acid synthetase